MLEEKDEKGLESIAILIVFFLDFFIAI